MHHNILADSSAIIEFLNGNADYLYLRDLANQNLLHINDVILTELLPAMIATENYIQAEFIHKLPKVALKINWDEIRDYQIALMKNGYFRVGVSDLHIAQNCIQNDFLLISNDKHFKIIAQFTQLKLYK